MAHLVRRAVGQPGRLRTVRRDLPHVVLVVQQDAAIAHGPAARAEGRLLLDRVVIVEVYERRRDVPRDAGVCRARDVVDPVVVIQQIQDVTAVR